MFSSSWILNRWASTKMHRLAVISSALLLLVLLRVPEVSGEGSLAQEFEVRYLSGEPDYKSVNLTWEVEALNGGDQRDEPHRHHKAARGDRQQRSFNVYYCEIQNWGPHRCRSKTLTDNSEGSGNSKQYTMTVKNLRMATKYSFHVKPQTRPGDQKISGRSEHDEDEFDGNSINFGQTVIIPTKGFSAHATQCLPHASEIEVQTGPYFGGRISSENGQCNIQGDANSPQDSYVMRIEHEHCGSRVNPADLTVETYITVQENLGILTHSTRRFVVVCTFQPDTLTVRARLALPGKGKGGAAPVPMTDYWPATGRNARVRQFNMVDKTSLVLKASDEEEMEDILPMQVKEVEEKDVSGQSEQETGTEINFMTERPTMKQELNSKENEIVEKKSNSRRADKSEPFRDAKYARLFETKSAAGDNDVGVSEMSTGYGEDEFSSRASSGGGDRSVDLPSLLISASLAVIMIGAFVYVLLKEYKKQRIIQQHHQQTQRPPNRMPAF